MAKSRAELLKLAERDYVEKDGVRLQSLSELELSELRTRWGTRYNAHKKLDLVMRRELLVACIVDDNGDRIFSDDEIELLGGWNGSVTERLYEECRKVCGLDLDDEVEETVKNSEATTG